MTSSGKKDRVVLVIGADGRIGHALAEACSAAGDLVIGTTRRPDACPPHRIRLDLSREIGEVALPQRIEAAFICAGTTSLSDCERDPADTARINVEQTVALARRLVADGVWVGFPSTNVVYDGAVPHRRGDEPVCPVCEYGRQKAQAEAEILALGPSVGILRLTKVVGSMTEPFASWIASMKRGESIDAFSDKVCAPVSLQSTVAILQGLAAGRKSGVFQASAAHDLRYAEVALFLARQVGARAGLVHSVEGNARGVPAILRPQHTTLDGERLRRELGWSPPEPEEALREGLGL